MTVVEIYAKADRLYQKMSKERNAYVKGYLDALNDTFQASDDFFEQLATALRDLWPSGEKDGKYPWRDSVPNLVKRLQFLWKDRQLADKYSIDDCLVAARRYLAQFETNVKYMQVLKYFIFKQNKLVGKDGRVTYTYKSTFADLLESNPTDTSDWADIFESSNTLEQGELI